MTKRPILPHGVMRAVCRLVGAALVLTSAHAAEDLGQFTGRSDIGELKRPGTFAYDPAKGSYTLGAAGLNMWARRDDFNYVWKKMTGDVAISAEIDFVSQGGDPHRKACLVIRQTLAADSAYVDAATHGDGLTSLQFREAAGDVTREVQARATAPRRIRLDKIGDMVYLSLAGSDGVFSPAGGSVKLPFTGEFYVGLAACAHNADGFVEVKFSHVHFGPTSPAVVAIRSSLETVAISSGDRRSVFATTERIEAPNWSKDNALYYNGGGRIYRLPLTGPAVPERIDTGTLTRLNNDHGISPDGTQLVISDGTKPGGSRIYVLPITGGTPRELTPLAPSYWHGWSPDGLTHVFCGKRDGRFGVFTVPAAGGEEKRLTTAATPDGLDDGPEYSPDGKWIYFNSDRTGLMQIWRMKPDGTEPEQVTKDGLNNWFAHPSPNGRWLAYLTFAADVKGHPADKDVMIRLLPVASIGATPAPGAASGEPRVLVKLFGGQGTMNVPSWSPDSTRLAYVRYQPAVARPAAK